MAERPILFSTPMVKAILEGRKTQTRRVVTPRPDNGPEDWDNATELECGLYWPTVIDKDGESQPADKQIFGAWNCGGDAWRFPYGQVGDRLWVRETFYVQPDIYTAHTPSPIHYKTDGHTECLEDYIIKPSIFMPRWASRILLEITAIRVERVQDISGEDCEAEGIQSDIDADDWDFATQAIKEMELQRAYARLWNSINAKRGYSWESNPWVWAIEFKKLEGTNGQI